MSAPPPFPLAFSLSNVQPLTSRHLTHSSLNTSSIRTHHLRRVIQSVFRTSKSTRSQISHNSSDPTSNGTGGAGVGPGGGSGGSGDPNPQDDPEHIFLNWPLILRLYMRQLYKRPLLTKIATAAIIGAISDIITQIIEAWGAHRFNWSLDILNYTRVMALAAVGAVLTAPMFHYLYQLLEWYAPSSKNLFNTAFQLAVDQLVAAPLWLVAFFGLVSVFEGRFDLQELQAQVERDFTPSLKLVWTIFPAVQLFNFTLVPINLRVLVLNVVDFVFTAVLSYIKHAPGDSKHASVT